MHIPSHRVFLWQSQQKNRDDQRTALPPCCPHQEHSSLPSLLCFTSRSAPAVSTPSPHSGLVWVLSLGPSSFWSNCKSQSLILGHIWIETSFYIIPVPFLENYSFGCLSFPYRYCGKYSLKGETGKCPILFWSTPQTQCQDVMCLILGLHWCLPTGASL